MIFMIDFKKKQYYDKFKRTWIILAIIISISVIISCGSTENNQNPVPELPLTENQIKEQLLLKECQKPVQYLDGVLKYRPRFKNVLSSKVKAIILQSTITSNATLASLSDIKFTVKFKSKTGTVVLAEDFTIYENIQPNGTIKYNTEFDISNQNYKDIQELEWEITGANCN